jgi:hypothetical protein
MGGEGNASRDFTGKHEANRCRCTWKEVLKWILKGNCLECLGEINLAQDMDKR